MENDLKRLDKKTLYKQVGEELREYIIRNGLKENDRLPTEMDLAKSMGVSRNSVREGIRYLETMGYIETYIKSGITVKAQNLDPLADVLSFNCRRMNITIEDLYEARLLLELDAAGLAVRNITTGQLAVMEQSIIRSEEKYLRGEEITGEDFTFHNTLFIAAKNKVIEQFNTVLAEVFTEESRKFNRAKVDKTIIINDQEPIEEHKRILAALKAGDAEILKKEILRHLSKIRKEIIQ